MPQSKMTHFDVLNGHGGVPWARVALASPITSLYGPYKAAGYTPGSSNRDGTEKSCIDSQFYTWVINWNLRLRLRVSLTLPKSNLA